MFSGLTTVQSGGVTDMASGMPDISVSVLGVHMGFPGEPPLMGQGLLPTDQGLWAHTGLPRFPQSLVTSMSKHRIGTSLLSPSQRASPSYCACTDGSGCSGSCRPHLSYNFAFKRHGRADQTAPSSPRGSCSACCGHPTSLTFVPKPVLGGEPLPGRALPTGHETHEGDLGQPPTEPRL